MSADIATPAVLDAYSLAEYIELLMLVNPEDHLSPSELRSHFPSGQGPASADISLAMAEVERRAAIAAPVYPYRVSDGGITRLESQLVPAYDLMSLCSMENTPMRLEAEYGESDPLFDAIVREATARIWGDEGRSLVFGWPPQDDRPTGFSEAVTWVGTKLGIPDGVMDRPTEEKDAGVDVISWRPFADGRTAYPVYLFQNTIRANYVNKVREVEPSMWHSWLRFGRMPSVGFAIPFAVPHGDDRWLKLSYTADIVFDRLRIADHLKGLTSPFPELDAIKAFNEKQIASIVNEPAPHPVSISRPRRQRDSPNRDTSVR